MPDVHEIVHVSCHGSLVAGPLGLLHETENSAGGQAPACQKQKPLGVLGFHLRFRCRAPKAAKIKPVVKPPRRGSRRPKTPQNTSETFWVSTKLRGRTAESPAIEALLMFSSFSCLRSSDNLESHLPLLFTDSRPGTPPGKRSWTSAHCNRRSVYSPLHLSAVLCCQGHLHTPTTWSIASRSTTAAGEYLVWTVAPQPSSKTSRILYS